MVVYYIAGNDEHAHPTAPTALTTATGPMAGVYYAAPIGCGYGLISR